MSGAGDIRLEVAVGAASPPAMTLRAGEPRDVFSVGLEGSWSVAAEGIAAIHAYFVFDGEALFVASADERRPAAIDGAPVGTSWTPVPVPGEVALGRCVLRARAAFGRPDAPLLARTAENEKTQAIERTQALPPPPRPPLAFAPTVPQPARPSPQTQVQPTAPTQPMQSSSPDSSRTRIAPVETMHAAAPFAHAPPSPYAPFEPTATFAAPPPTFTAAPSTGPQPEGAPVTPTKPLRNVPAFWAQASIPKRITYILLPFALLATAYVLLADDDNAPGVRRPSNVTAPSTVAAASASPARPPPTVVAATVNAANTVEPAPPGTPRPLPTPIVPATPHSRSLPAWRTAEREVVDLIAVGSYAEAAQRLDELAAAQPGHPEYREAARVLRRKADAPPR